MNGALLNILNKVLGSWIENLNSEQFSLSIFSGTVELENLKLKPDIFQILGLPIKLLSGTVGHIKIKIPWSAWYSSPLIIDIENLFILLSPNSPDHWNEKDTKDLILKNKKYLLDQFEVVHAEGSEFSNSGLFGTLTSKIVDNLCVRVRNVYVRYEDKSSFLEPFAVGCYLKQVDLFNCNDLWEAEHRSNSTERFKLMLIENISLFVDYEDGIIISQEWYEGSLQEVLFSLSCDELQESVEHKFILHPFSTRIELVLAKSAPNDLTPKISVRALTDELKLELNTHQIKILVKFEKFINTYSSYIRGLERSFLNKNFDREIEIHYQSKYRKLRKRQRTGKYSQEKLDRLKAKIEKLEEGILAAEIMMHRRCALTDLKMDKIKEDKEKEIKQVKNSGGRRFTTKIADFFSRKTEAEKAQEEKNRKQRLSVAENDLKRIFLRTQSIVKQVSSNLTDREPETLLKYSLEMTISHVSILLKEDSHDYSDLQLFNIHIKTLIRPYSQKLHFSISDLTMLNLFGSSEIYPKFLDSKQLLIEYDSFGPKYLKIKTVGLSFCFDLESISQIAGNIKKSFSTDKDWIKYLEQISDTTERYVMQGSQYLRDAIETGVSSKYELDIDIKAPIVVIPVNIHEDKAPVMVFDFGTLSASTHSRASATCEYHVYKFLLDNFKVYLESEEISSIVEPSKLAMEMFMAASSSTKDVHLYIRTVIDRIETRWTDSTIGMLAEFYHKYCEICSILYENTENLRVSSVTDSKPDSYTSLYQLQIGELSAELDLQPIKLLLAIGNVKGKLQMFAEDKNSFKVLLGVLKMMEMKEKVWRDIVCAAKPTEEVFEDARQRFYQIMLSGTVDFKNSVTDISGKLTDLRILAEIPFLQTLLQVLAVLQEKFYDQSILQSTPTVSLARPSLLYTSNKRLAIQFDSLQVKLPVQVDNSWECLETNMNMSLILVYEEKGEKRINRHGSEVWRQLIESKNEVNLMLNHFGMKLKHKECHKTLLESSRVSVDYLKIMKHQCVPETQIQTRMESMALVLGFRDFDYLFTVKAAWYNFFFPKTEIVHEFQSTHVIDFDSLQITLQEDAAEEQYSLAFLQFSNFLYTISNESGKYQCLLTCVFFMDFYNLSTGIWEPLVEDWKFSYSFIQKNPDAPFETVLESKEFLNINVTKYMCKTIGIIYQRLYQTSKDWPMINPNEIPLRKKLDYRIVNRLGIDLQVWFVDKEKDLVCVGDEGEFVIEDLQMKKIFAKKKPKNKFEAGKICVPAASLLPEGFSPVTGLVLEDVGVEKFVLVNQNEKMICRKNIEIKKNFRIVTFFRDFIVKNLSGTQISLFYEYEKIVVDEIECFLPIPWEVPKIKIQTSTGLKLLTDFPTLKLFESVFVSTDISISHDPQTSSAITIFAPYTIINNLPCSIHVFLFQEKIALIESGETFLLTLAEYSNSLEFSLELNLTHTSLFSDTFQINSDLSSISIKNKQGWKIQSQIKFPTPNSVSIKLFSQYLLVNCTEFPIDFNTLHISPNELAFIGYTFEDSQIRTVGEFASEWSEKFNPKAVGVASCVYLSLENPIIKTLAFGVKVTQASAPLQVSKIIKIVPRFVIVNYLDFKVFVRQSCKAVTRIVEIEAGKSIQYQFDDIGQGSVLQVSEDKLQWSGKFDGSALEDFQVRFKAAPRVIPPKVNILAFDMHWYLPCVKNHLYFYIRVCVSTEDDACIKITFSLPLTPNFKIHNSLSDPLQVKQCKTKTQSEIILPGHSVPWAFTDHSLKNKKVSLTYNKYKKKYSLEKIKEKNKDLGPFLVSINFEGECRVLRIYEAEETHSQMKIGLFKQITQTTSSKLQMLFAGIHFSLLDEGNAEKFLVTLTEVNWKSGKEVDKRNTISKVRVKYHLIVGSLQVDNMKTDKKLFPVLAFHTEINEKTPFFEFRYGREFTTGAAQSIFHMLIDRILELELQMQSLNLHLNIETIFSLFALCDMYYKDFFNVIEKKLLSDNIALEERYPELAQHVKIPETCQRSIKSYFKYVRIHGVKLILSFANTGLHLVSEELFPSFSELVLDLASFENSNLKFTEIILQYSFQNFYDLSWILLQNYLRQFLLQFYLILGSSTLLGNPLGLIDKLGTGVYEFFNEPAKGLLRGPKGFIHGISKGTKSLLSNVIGGSFESVSKITSSLYKIVGQEQASNSLYSKLGLTDLTSGVSGIVTKPYEGLKNKGAAGLVMGVGSGVFGALISPVAAILHFSSTVTSQVARTAGKLQNLSHTGRVRFPRHVNKRRVLEPYDHNLAKIWYFVSMKGFSEEEILALVELEREYIVVTKEKLYVLVGEDVVDKFLVSEFFVKEIHLYRKKFFLKFVGREVRFCMSSEYYGRLLKLYESVSFVKCS